MNKHEQNHEQNLAPNSDRLLELCKAIGHEVRFSIIKHLVNQTQFCGDLVTELGLAQSTVSHHLKILRESGLVIAEEQGSWVCYRLNRHVFNEMKDMIAPFAE